MVCVKSLAKVNDPENQREQDEGRHQAEFEQRAATLRVFQSIPFHWATCICALPFTGKNVGRPG
jgi:hypothetical protein